MADVAELDVGEVRRHVAEFAAVAGAQEAAIAQHTEDVRRSATQAAGLAAEFGRQLTALADYAERLADRQARLGRLAVVRGGVRLEGTADGGVVVVVYEAAAENAAVIRTVVFSPEDVMLSVAPLPLVGVEPLAPQPQPEVALAATAPQPEVAPIHAIPQPAAVTPLPPTQVEVVSIAPAAPATPRPGGLRRFLSRLRGCPGRSV